MSPFTLASFGISSLLSETSTLSVLTSSLLYSKF
jgi:hypothetical protein